MVTKIKPKDKDMMITLNPWPWKPGDRVGAIIGVEPGSFVVRFLGYGTYKGNRVPPKSAGGLGEFLHKMKMKNPMIRLDNGITVYGCECWWDSENAMKKTISKWIVGGYKIVKSEIKEMRDETQKAK